MDCSQKHAYANKKDKNMRPAAINIDKTISYSRFTIFILRTKRTCRPYLSNSKLEGNFVICFNILMYGVQFFLLLLIYERHTGQIRINIAPIEDFYVKNNILTEDFYIFLVRIRKKLYLCAVISNK